MYNLCVFVCLTKITFFSLLIVDRTAPEESMSTQRKISRQLSLKPTPWVWVWSWSRSLPTLRLYGPGDITSEILQTFHGSELGKGCVCKYAYSHCCYKILRQSHTQSCKYKNWYKYTRVVCVRKVALPVIVINCRPLHCAAYTQGEHPFKSQTRM